MTQIYEGMFLLDNQVVREDWKKAKAIITDTLAKHGATVHTARRWDERKLAYPIRRKHRATYILTYYEIPGEGIAPMLRDFNLNENVLRYLNVSVDEIPEEERNLSEVENSADFVVPPPPADDAPDLEEERSYDEDEDDDDGPRGSADDSDDDDQDEDSPRGARKSGDTESDED